VNIDQRRNHHIQAELDELLRLNIINEDQFQQLKSGYPITNWDYLMLIRAFTILGALTAAAGYLILIRSYLNWWLVSEFSLLVIAAILICLGRWLKIMKSMRFSGETAELAGSIAFQGLITVLAIHHSTGSKNWPALFGIETFFLFVMAYVLANPLILWYSCANFFFWFGAETGYISGWGCYWLGMTYPVRFLAAGIGTLLLSWLHMMNIRGRWTVFSRVYAHFGLLIINLSLWFLSLFGYYEDYNTLWRDSGSERLFFTFLWAIVSGASLFAGSKYGIRFLRAYGLTFFFINIYTFYFQFIAANLPELWFVHFLIIGGSLIGIARHMEQKLYKKEHKN